MLHLKTKVNFLFVSLYFNKNLKHALMKHSSHLFDFVFWHILTPGRWTLKIHCFMQSRSKHCHCVYQLFGRYMEIAVLIWRAKRKAGQVCRLSSWTTHCDNYKTLSEIIDANSLIHFSFSVNCSEELDRCGVCFVKLIKHHVSAYLVLHLLFTFWGSGVFCLLAFE